MASGSVFSQTLQTVTNTKLEELAKQRLAFTTEYEELLKQTSSNQNARKRLQLLVEGTKSCLGIKISTGKEGQPSRVTATGLRNLRLETDLKNLDRFLEQAKFDPSISDEVFDGWQETLLQYLAVQAAKFEYADLYGKLVTEWLSSETEPSPIQDVEMTGSFEELPGVKKMEARTEWEKSVFEEADINVQSVKDYLNQLFTSNKKTTSALNGLRDEVEEFELSLGGSAQFNVSTLRWVIKGLSVSDLLSNEKREALKDFLSNEVILKELADVLNMRMVALDRWTWGNFVALEQRRKLNGGWSIHMDAEVLQAIFLHYIGVKWSVFFKTALSTIRDNSDAWKSSHVEVSKVDRMRRAYFLGTQGTATHATLADKRNSIHRRRYFAHQLLDHDTQRIEMQEGEEEAEFGSYVESAPRKHGRAEQTARKSSMTQRQQRMVQQQPQEMLQTPMRCRRIIADCDAEMDEDDDSEEGYQPSSKRPMEAKQELLHLLSTEIILNVKLHGDITCFHTAFESWNPLLPHQTVLSVLDFFGISAKWKSFFTKFLQAPLKFAEDGASSDPRLRRRGIPGSYVLSDMLGETTLFCLDFAVNQSTNGALLHRIYDDVWFWSKDYEKCAVAWSTVNRFTDVMGVELDGAKTGGVRVSRNNELKIDDRVPEGEIRWGFLYLHPDSGRFEIDQKMVDGHVEELRKQLQSKKSVIDWIQAYNSYATTFFSANFGKAAHSFGRDHVDSMLATHQHIQEALFEGGNVVQHLKQMITSRFGVDKIPDGFLFFPVQLGGLELKSPFVDLLQIRATVEKDPKLLIRIFEENERDDYAAAQGVFDRGEIRNRRYIAENPNWVPDDADTFFSFEEFIRHREEFNSMGKANLRTTFTKLLKRPKELPIDISPQVRQAIDQLAGQSTLRGITSDWGKMTPYWKWVAQMYGDEMWKKFGGMNFVDFGLLPIGMVGFFRERRTKWEG